MSFICIIFQQTVPVELLIVQFLQRGNKSVLTLSFIKSQFNSQYQDTLTETCNVNHLVVRRFSVNGFGTDNPGCNNVCFIEIWTIVHCIG